MGVIIAENTRVTLHFSLKLEDGTVIDSTFTKQPASFTTGDGSLLNGFEQKLFGMEAGQQGDFTIIPEEGFGQVNPKNVHNFPRKHFADDMDFALGLVISFSDASKSELPGVVKSFNQDTVVVDFNHPLAGRTILFYVEILAVEIVAEKTTTSNVIDKATNNSIHYVEG